MPFGAWSGSRIVILCAACLTSFLLGTLISRSNHSESHQSRLTGVHDLPPSAPPPEPVSSEPANIHATHTHTPYTASLDKLALETLQSTLFWPLYQCPRVKPAPRVWEYYAQSHEDIAIFTKFFQNPSPKTQGIFVEMGAVDGTSYSNTRYFEEMWDWRGVLIEAQPQSCRTLQHPDGGFAPRHNSVRLCTAICDESAEHKLEFLGMGAAAGATGTMAASFRKAQWSKAAPMFTVHCSPLGLLLRATGIDYIDFFSLDVEGAELAVLKTFDWSIPVKVWVVELDNHDPAKDEEVRKLLRAHSYQPADFNIRDFCDKGQDCTSNEVFVHPRYDELVAEIDDIRRKWSYYGQLGNCDQRGKEEKPL